MRKNFPSKLKKKLVIGIVNSNPHAKNQLCIFNILEVMSSQSYVRDIGDYSHCVVSFHMNDKIDIFPLQK